MTQPCLLHSISRGFEWSVRGKDGIFCGLHECRANSGRLLKNNSEPIPERRSKELKADEQQNTNGDLNRRDGSWFDNFNDPSEFRELLECVIVAQIGTHVLSATIKFFRHCFLDICNLANFSFAPHMKPRRALSRR